ncbi:hypothetical protein MMC29_007829 [Sticta canariensis]|nr:hypothetical protein [Sticta canariensis]
MRGAPRLANLVSIVVDASRKYLKSYLIEYPKARWRIDRIVLDPSISWDRRQKWAKQLVETVAHLHSKGFVAGMICTYRMPVIIDSSDSVQFSFFRKKFVMGRTQGGYYPPEYHYLSEASPMTSEAECPDITSKTDIFHLGLMLWTLASGQRMWKSLVRTRIGCKQASPCNNESHAKPNALAPLSASIPQYYKNLVNSCVSENPGDRPAARDLLATFTPERQLQTAQPKSMNNSNGPGCKEIIALGQGISTHIACSRCHEGHIQETNFFHCNTSERTFNSITKQETDLSQCTQESQAPRHRLLTSGVAVEVCEYGAKQAIDRISSIGKALSIGNKGSTGGVVVVLFRVWNISSDFCNGCWYSNGHFQTYDHQREAKKSHLAERVQRDKPYEYVSQGGQKTSTAWGYSWFLLISVDYRAEDGL